MIARVLVAVPLALALTASARAQSVPDPVEIDPDLEDAPEDVDALFDLDSLQGAPASGEEQGLRARIRALKALHGAPPGARWLPRISVVVRAAVLEGGELDREAGRPDRLGPRLRSELRWLVLASWGPR